MEVREEEEEDDRPTTSTTIRVVMSKHETFADDKHGVEEVQMMV